MNPDIEELNERLHERTQGFLDRAAQDKRTIDALREALAEIVEIVYTYDPEMPRTTLVLIDEKAREALKL